MTLTIIWLIACPIADPSACRKVRLETRSASPSMAMIEASAWLIDHPAYRQTEARLRR